MSVDDLLVVTVSGKEAELAENIAEHVGQKEDVLDIMEPREFTGGEYNPKFRVSPKDKTVAVVAVQGVDHNPSESVLRMAMVARAAKQSGASRVIAVMTDLPYGRQDRDPWEDDRFVGEPNSSRVVASSLKPNGVDGVLTMDVHSPLVTKIYQEELGRPDAICNISSHALLAHYLLHNSDIKITDKGRNISVLACDEGRAEYVRKLNKCLGLPNSTELFFDKARRVPNKPDAVTVNILNLDELIQKGYRFDGQVVISAEDIIDTAGTQEKIRNWLYQVHPEFAHHLGTPGELFLFATHAVLGGLNYMAVQRKLYQHVPAREYVFTDTRPFISDRREYWFKRNSTVLRVGRLFGEALLKCCQSEVMPSTMFDITNRDELEILMEKLYWCKRSSRHFMVRPNNHPS